MLNWNDLRVFLALARAGTLAGAARALDVDQSTVGRRVTALEQSVGAALFDRRPDGYALTAAGEAVLRETEEIEERAIAVERKLAGENARVEGPVRLATSDSFAAWFLVRKLVGLRARHPDVVVQLVTGNRPVDLGRREADLSIRLTRPVQPNLVARRLGTGAWALYASRSYLSRHGIPEPRSGLAGHDIVGYDPELGGTAGARWLQANAARARQAMVTNSLLSQAAAVVAGHGVSALPCLFGDREPTLRRVPPGLVGHHDIWMVVHPDMHKSARVRAVMDYLVAVIKEEGPLLAGELERPQSRARQWLPNS